MNEKNVLQGYAYAKERFGEVGVDIDAAIKQADSVPVSMHSWQGDDLIGFDGSGALTGGIAATGNYPGRARTPEELRCDMEEAMRLIPGMLKVNLHACHAEKSGADVDRDSISILQFQNWVDWAKERGLGMDFNPTFFSHPRMDGDFSLSSYDSGVRQFWIEHGRRCREIGREFVRQLGTPCVVNYWMPDGYKDTPADTVKRRTLMADSLDRIFKTDLGCDTLYEAIESKLFGFGVESYTVVNHEFAMGYSLSRNKLYCLDAGHFHPTEVISAKISALMPFYPRLMLHVSRGVRWDSDHVVTWDDELQQIMDEVILNGYAGRVSIGLDFFDASINRIACWVIGTRNTRKALLSAALAPIARAREAEERGDYTARLAYLEARKTLPVSAVWDYYCLSRNIPGEEEWLCEVKRYEADVLAKRNG